MNDILTMPRQEAAELTLFCLDIFLRAAQIIDEVKPIIPSLY
jgi:hypothetical protein